LQSLRGSVFTSAGRQVPTLLAELQVTQTPSQALLQQTPSAQNFDAQSVPVVHGAPSAPSEVVGWSTPPSMPTCPPVDVVVPPLPIVPALPPFPPPAAVPPLPTFPPVPVDLPPLLHPPTLEATERIKAEATMSARTLGWGKPMVMGRPFLPKETRARILQSSRCQERGEFVTLFLKSSYAGPQIESTITFKSAARGITLAG
jgi:hypothetical protein